MQIFLLFISILLLGGCSTRGHKVYNQNKANVKLKPIKSTQSTHSKIPLKNIQKNANYKTKVLFSEYEKWRGVPYKLGGVSLTGVDCSSFIQQVYYDAFGLRIPRTTINQLKIGIEVDKKDLKVGDMIFFRTGWDVRHVGIIIEDGAFVHASTSQGVTISSIYNPYWVDNYYQSRRILP